MDEYSRAQVKLAEAKATALNAVTLWVALGPIIGLVVWLVER